MASFFLLTKRVVRFSMAPTGDRFAPRHDNQTSWVFSGPFTARRAAERAAVNALATHTCLAAQVLSAEEVVAAAESGSFAPDHARDEAVRVCKRHGLGRWAPAPVG